MALYEFLTTWCLDAPITDVFDLLDDPRRYPEWWTGVTRVEMLDPGEAGGVGQTYRFTMRSALPYSLTFDSQVARRERPFVLEAKAYGELEGTGTWRLYEGAAGTAVVYDWRVRTTRAWMNLMGPVARPAFVWNHDHIMRQGGAALARALSAKLIAAD